MSDSAGAKAVARDWAAVGAVMLSFVTVVFYGGKAIERLDTLNGEVIGVKTEIRFLASAVDESRAQAQVNAAKLRIIDDKLESLQGRIKSIEASTQVLTGDIKIEPEKLKRPR